MAHMDNISPAWHTGDRIRKARTTAELTQDELARRVGAGRKTIARWEAGTTVPPAWRLDLIAQHCGVSAAWLRGEAAA